MAVAIFNRGDTLSVCGAIGPVLPAHRKRVLAIAGPMARRWRSRLGELALGGVIQPMASNLELTACGGRHEGSRNRAQARAWNVGTFVATARGNAWRKVPMRIQGTEALVGVKNPRNGQACSAAEPAKGPASS